MQIISKRKRTTHTCHRLTFEYLDDPGAGFSFECDAQGNVFEDKLEQVAKENLADCLKGTAWNGKPLTPGRVETYSNTFTEPAIGRCQCGRTVELSGFTNPCDCGRDYNSGGQLLAPRSQWGEETGESETDILRIDCTPTDQLFEE